MAKINHILFGQGKGKVGGLVLQRYEGMNVVREKPISVKNPQSTKQTTQRAKFKLASQALAEFKEVISLRLSPISIYERTRRSSAVNALIGAIDTTNPNKPNLALDNAISAINEKSLSGINVIALGIGQTGFTVTVTTGFTVTYAICSYDNGGNLVSKQTESFTSDGTAKDVPFGNGATSAIMVVAYRATTDTGRAIISNIDFSADDSKWQNEISRGVSAGDIEVSNIVGEIS